MVSSNKSDLSRRERWLDWRNRILGDPQFQRFAARFPLTRPIARVRARELFDLVAGFTYSQTLFACVQSRVLDVLGDGPLDTAAIAARIDLAQEATERLLRAAAALRLTQSVGERWMLGSAGAAMRGNRGIAEMVAHHDRLYADLADPLALFRRGGGGGALQRYWRYAETPGGGEAERVGDYSALMAASQPLVAAQVIDAYPFARHRRMLDVGGGSGAFLAAVHAAAPSLELALFDLPEVGALAGACFESLVPGAGIGVHGGNFLADPLPPEFDLITLVRIIHDHDDGPALTLMRAVHAALPTGGKLLIAEPMAGTRGAEPAGDAYFGLYLLAMGSGRPRTYAEIAAMAKAAGFVRIREARTALPLTTRLLIADK